MFTTVFESFSDLIREKPKVDWIQLRAEIVHISSTSTTENMPYTIDEFRFSLLYSSTVINSMTFIPISTCVVSLSNTELPV